MSKHTPGPWRVNDQRESGVMNNGVYVLGGRNNFVRVFDEWRDEEIQLANARLIAAAPELLEALDEIANESLYCMLTHDARSEFVELQVSRQALAKARAAIAKATGEA